MLEKSTTGGQDLRVHSLVLLPANSLCSLCAVECDQLSCLMPATCHAFPPYEPYPAPWHQELTQTLSSVTSFGCGILSQLQKHN